ncbi:MAG: ATP synthase F1 subunit delta [Chloroflexi bacterium]|nr:MAG: ATP synthase F1 subunit delta [Chloroflexota bacterium]
MEEQEVERLQRKQEMANTYAQAFYEAAMESWLKRLSEIWGSLSRDGLLEKLNNPDIPFSEKETLINEAVGKDSAPEIRNFISLLATRGHLHYLPEILDELARLSRGGAVRQLVVITSAVPLTEEEKARLQRRLINLYGPYLDFRYYVDPDILGGMVVRIGDRVIDGSIRGRLEALRERLKQEI